MPRLIPLKPEEVLEKLRQLGYIGPIGGGRHIHFVKGSHTLPVPFHRKDIPVGLILEFIKEIGIDRDTRINL